AVQNVQVLAIRMQGEAARSALVPRVGSGAGRGGWAYFNQVRDAPVEGHTGDAVRAKRGDVEAVPIRLEGHRGGLRERGRACCGVWERTVIDGWVQVERHDAIVRYRDACHPVVHEVPA